MPTLKVLDLALAVPVFEVPVGTSTVGRGSECALVLADKSISRVHARIERVGDVLHLEDLGSRNGTTVNGVRVEGRVPLGDGDRIRFGAIEVAFDRGAAAEAETVFAGDLAATVAPSAKAPPASSEATRVEAARSPSAPRAAAPAAPATASPVEPTQPIRMKPAPTALELGWIALAAYLVVVLLGLLARNL